MENQIQQNSLPSQPLIQASVSKPTNWVTIVFLILLGIAIVAVLAFAYVQAGNKQISNQQSSIERQTIGPTRTVIEPTTLPTAPSSIDTIRGVKLSGIIKEVNTGCWADGICSIKVENKWIIAEIGGLRAPNSKLEIKGKLIGINFGQDVDKYIGKSVEIYAEQTGGGGFTIYGDEGYYVKLLD